MQRTFQFASGRSYFGHKILRSGERGKDKRKRKPRTCRVCLQDCPNNASCHGRHPRGRHNCACTNEEKSNSNSKNVRIVNMNVQRIEGTSNSISAAYTGIDMAIPDQVDSSLLASSSSAFSTAKSSKQPKRKRKREESQSQLISVSGKRQKVSINHHNNSSSGSKSVELDDSKVEEKTSRKEKEEIVGLVWQLVSVRIYVLGDIQGVDIIASVQLQESEEPKAIGNLEPVENVRSIV
eukprot:CAMPEP_0204825516 /NCGR_PEP_ID=MMETSP1346-20131115/3390_1 /ASSEMBLY_ACC=CAM_ASM_000771 /TAXON_ID=215587 /ORGANISM="Aplanochytrium stocchinoi, Strain GSBS06" /LENGTH=236 /DNA_ID=CAMNT_0051953169 /DNA_START=305 /DNA_END=1016 /DNA_ORIENTATION=+